MTQTDNKLQQLSIEDFAAYSGRINYYNDDIIVSGSIEDLPHLWNRPLRLNFFCVITCSAGEMQMEVDNNTYSLKPGDSLIIMPTMILGGALVSPQHKVSLVGFSTRFLQRTLKQGNDNTQVLKHFLDHPVRHAGDFGEQSIYQFYTDLIVNKVNEPESSPLRKDILEYLFAALLCEILKELMTLRPVNNDKKAQEVSSLKGQRATEIFRRFIKEVNADNGRHRSLNYFADRLCYTPKYVSNVIKLASGRSALDWINEIAMEQIKYQLKHSTKSMKEIADEFNFPNQSFFGKYVKKHLGISPARYRE